MASNSRKAARGLVNVGNTCYLNSVVQSLNAFPLFHKYIAALKLQGQSNPLLDKVKDTLDALKEPKGIPFKPSLVLDESLRKHFRPGDQQDAHEFLTFLLDEIVAGPGSGTTPVAAAKATGLAALLSTPDKEKSRMMNATSRSATASDAVVQQHDIQLTQSLMVLPNAGGSGVGSPAHMTHLFASGTGGGESTRSPSNAATPFYARTPPSATFPARNNGRNIRESLSTRGAATNGMNSSSQPTSSGPSHQSSIHLNASLTYSAYAMSPTASLGSSGHMSSPLALLQAATKARKAIPSPFLGKMESTSRCRRCKSSWSMIQPMTMLSAYIPAAVQNKQSASLQECIANFVLSESVRGVVCPKCKVPSQVEKRLSVAKEPEILCIFINRLKYEKGKNQPRKLDTHIEFDEMFDLSVATSQLTLKSPVELRADSIFANATDSASALSGHGPFATSLSVNNGSSTATTATSPSHLWSGRTTPSEASSVASTSEFLEARHPTLTQPLGDATPDQPRFLYQLVAVIVHIGNALGGHYIMFKATNEDRPAESEWIRISDSDVAVVPFDFVKRQHAYMLFYQKVLPNLDYTLDPVLESEETPSSFLQQQHASTRSHASQPQSTLPFATTANFGTSSAPSSPPPPAGTIVSPIPTSASPSMLLQTSGSPLSSYPNSLSRTSANPHGQAIPNGHTGTQNHHSSGTSNGSTAPYPPNGFLRKPGMGFGPTRKSADDDHPDSDSDDSDSPLPLGVVHEPSPLAHPSPPPTHASDTDPKVNKIFLQPEDDDASSNPRDDLRQPLELLQRPLQTYSDPHEGFNSILESRVDS